MSYKTAFGDPAEIEAQIIKIAKQFVEFLDSDKDKASKCIAVTVMLMQKPLMKRMALLEGLMATLVTKETMLAILEDLEKRKFVEAVLGPEVLQ